MIFQSTPSVKRATALSLYLVVFFCISIHTLCEEGDIYKMFYNFEIVISIHTLCEEGDDDLYANFFYYYHFNPHPL